MEYLDINMMKIISSFIFIVVFFKIVFKKIISKYSGVENGYIISLVNSLKGFDYLVRIWDKVVKQHPDWTLKIVGDGEQETAIRNFIKKNDSDDINEWESISLRSALIEAGLNLNDHDQVYEFKIKNSPKYNVGN